MRTPHFTQISASFLTTLPHELQNFSSAFNLTESDIPHSFFDLTFYIFPQHTEKPTAHPVLEPSQQQDVQRKSGYANAASTGQKKGTSLFLRKVSP